MKDLVYGLIVSYGYLISLLICLAGFIYAAAKAKMPLFKQVVYTCAAVPLALFLFEVIGYLKSDKLNRPQEIKEYGTWRISKDYSVKSEALGYAPEHSHPFSVRGCKVVGDDTIYDVEYSFSNGYRVTPNTNTNSQTTVCFMGCSLTYGEGVENTETVAYYFNEFSEPDVLTINMGFTGYGTHQVVQQVSALPTVPQESNSIVIYTFIEDHISRAAGNKDWDFEGPWFENENGQLVHKGTFKDKYLSRRNRFIREVYKVFRNSQLYKSYFSGYTLSPSDYERTSAMILHLKKALEAKNYSFYTLIISPKGGEVENIFKIAESNGIKGIWIEDVISDYWRNLSLYTLPNDGHPNAKCNKMIAQYLANHTINNDKWIQ